MSKIEMRIIGQKDWGTSVDEVTARVEGADARAQFFSEKCIAVIKTDPSSQNLNSLLAECSAFIDEFNALAQALQDLMNDPQRQLGHLTKLSVLYSVVDSQLFNLHAEHFLLNHSVIIASNELMYSSSMQSHN